MQKGDEPSQMMEEPGMTDVWSPRSKTPRKGMRDSSAERGLAEAREANWKALATAVTLEEEIEWLSHLSPGAGQRPVPTPGAGIATDRNLRDGTGGTTRCGWRRALLLILNTTLPGGVQHLKKMRRLPWILTRKLHWSWDQRLTASSRAS